MSASGDQFNAPEAPLDAAVAEYIRRTDAGEQVDRQQFLTQYPRIASKLLEYLEGEDLVFQFAGPVVDPATNSSADASTQPPTAYETFPPELELSGEAAHRPDHVPVLSGTFGRYEIQKQLGRGAMGTVYLARDTQLDRNVALKSPLLTGANPGALLKRFYREARAAATLRHAGICPVYDVGSMDGVHYISMAYIDGKPLSKLLDDRGMLPARKAVLLVRRLATALRVAHDNGIVHRDLKPDNVMIDRSGEPVIMDFGLVLRTDALALDGSRATLEGMLMGTPAYMSPEQAQGKRDAVGPATDIYSLGVMLFEMLTGELPFCGSLAAVLGMIMTRAVPPPSSRNADVPDDVDAICRKMTDRSIEDRYQSMQDVISDVTLFLRGESPLATETHSLETVSESSPADDWPDQPLQSAAIREKLQNTQTRIERLCEEGGFDRAEDLLKEMATLAEIEAAPSVVWANQQLQKLPQLREEAREEADRLLRQAHDLHDRGEFTHTVKLLGQIPEQYVSTEARQLLDDALARNDEIELLLQVLDRAESTGQTEALENAARSLLAINPTHARAKQVLRRAKPKRLPAWFSMPSIQEASGGRQVAARWKRHVGVAATVAITIAAVIIFGPEIQVPVDPVPPPPIPVPEPLQQLATVWTSPVNLGDEVNSNGLDGYPTLSADGKTLVFVSSREDGGEGGSDLWMSRWDDQTASYGPAENLGTGVNTAFEDNWPDLSDDGLTLVYSSNGLNPDRTADLCMCRRDSINEPFRRAEVLAGVNSPYVDGEVNLSGDALTLVFFSDRPDGRGEWDLWMSDRESVADQFQQVTNLGETVNSEAWDGSPSLSADGLILIFATDRERAGKGRELMICSRTSRGLPFGSAGSLGPMINSSVEDTLPRLSSDGLTLCFESDRAYQEGFSGLDMWISRRTSVTDRFSPAEDFATSLNSPVFDGFPVRSADERVVVFHSDRPGGQEGWNLWMSTRVDVLVSNVGGHAYALLLESLDWPAAKARAEELGGHLAIIESQAEVDLVASFLEPGSSPAWVGASDEDKDGNWLWVNEQPVPRDRFWHAGEPGNSNGGGNYGAISSEDDGIGLRGFGETCSRFVCEWDHEIRSPIVAPTRVLDYQVAKSSLFPTNFARVDKLVLEVGNGNDCCGWGIAGVELDGVDEILVDVESSGTFRWWDANSFAGFVLDYHTEDGYSKRVAVALELVDRGRWEGHPSWGTANVPDEFWRLSPKSKYCIDLKRWAPENWDGQLWFTAMIQNGGPDTEMKASLSLDPSPTAKGDVEVELPVTRVTSDSGPPRYLAIWEKDDSSEKWETHHDLDGPSFQKTATRYAESGMDPTCISGYAGTTGEYQYAAVWNLPPANTQVEWRYDIAPTEFPEQQEDFRRRGFHPVWVDVYGKGSDWRYAMIWHNDGTDTPWDITLFDDPIGDTAAEKVRREEWDDHWKTFWLLQHSIHIGSARVRHEARLWFPDSGAHTTWFGPFSFYQSKLEEYRNARDHRPVYVDSYVDGDSTSYTLLGRSSGNANWLTTAAVDSARHQKAVDEMLAKGYRPQLVNVHSVNQLTVAP